jgi:hypothetical protein
MAKKVTFLIKRGETKKKIFKLFVDKRGDLFISFPYFDCKHYYCGTGSLPTDGSPRTYNVVAEGTDSVIPVKLSYHQDGQVHFKPFSSSTAQLPLAYKTAEIKGIPFSQLTSQHIITIEIEGLERFAEFRQMKKNQLYRGFDVPHDRLRFQFLFYAGLTAEDIKGKFQRCKLISIERPSKPNPLMMGLICTAFRDSLDTDKDNPHPSIICLAGFPRKDNKESQRKEFIYLMAN